MNGKTLVEFSFPKIMLVAGFAGSIYYNPDVNNDKLQTPGLWYYVDEYGLKNCGSYSLALYKGDLQ